MRALRKFVSGKLGIEADQSADAAKETIEILSHLSTYFIVGPEQKADAVLTIKKMCINLKFEKAICEIVGLHIERTHVKGVPGEADKAIDEALRDVFQACYTFLKLLVVKFPKGQETLFGYIDKFACHIGIEKLNVADTIAEILRDNSRLSSQIPMSFLCKYIDAIKTWGRRAQWLSVFQAFMIIGGKPIKRNQDMILNLVLEEAEILDLDCDYKNSSHLSASDERNGLSRLDLMAQNDHKRPIYSLLKYHTACVDLLAAASAGKNPDVSIVYVVLLNLRTKISI